MQLHLFLLHSSSSPCPPPPASLSHFILLLDVSRPRRHRILRLRWSRSTIRREFELSASRLTSVFQPSCDSFARSSFDVRATTFCSRWRGTSPIDLSSHRRCYLVEAAVDQTWARRVCRSAVAYIEVSSRLPKCRRATLHLPAMGCKLKFVFHLLIRYDLLHASIPVIRSCCLHFTLIFGIFVVSCIGECGGFTL